MCFTKSSPVRFLFRTSLLIKKVSRLCLYELSEKWERGGLYRGKDNVQIFNKEIVLTLTVLTQERSRKTQPKD